MNESVLRALLRLFALITEASDQMMIELAKNQVRAYLKPKISSEVLDIYLTEFEEYLHLFSRSPRNESAKKARKASTLGSVKVIMVCEKINENLVHSEKITVLIRLTEFVHKGGQISFRETNFLETLARIFNIEDEDYALIRHFILDGDHLHDALIFVDDDPDRKGKFLYRKNLSGNIIALLLPGSSKAYIKYTGTSELRINNYAMEVNTVYLFEEGGVISGKELQPIHHSELQLLFYRSSFTHNITYRADNISFRFPNGTVGVHPFGFRHQSGAMVGIMGASGAGKSTLLNVLNGNLESDTGALTINGISVQDLSAKQLIGYVPQDDLLIEELSVFENLFYSGKLCLPRLSKKELTSRIEELLQAIDLYEIRHLRVGSVLDKRISGGQRKRLNIALELLREPAVLFVDEPTSGLSSQDSEVVMRLLKQLTLKGKLIYVVIHQPSAHIYRLFDQLLLLDKGGFPVYLGHAMEAPAWFRKKAGYIARPGEGNLGSYQIDPDEMLRIIEARQVDEFGQPKPERIKSPEEWYQWFKAEYQYTEASENTTDFTADSNYTVPSGWRQFWVYLQRNLLAKVRNTPFLLVALLEAPLLAVIIGLFTRYAVGTEEDPEAYLLFYNKNLPAYLFMIIVVAIFVGMQISAEEIIRDRKILKRESFLNLSWSSYLNSKVLYLLILSAVQTILLVVTGNFILGIQGMFFYFAMVLFPTFVFANLVGLNISAAFKSVVTIYILVPFLVVPQLLLSGVIVEFDTLQDPEDHGRGTPLAADIMVARWAYEAMAVAQFKHNAYQKHFFDAEREKTEALYQFSLRMPKLQTLNQQCIKWLKDTSRVQDFRNHVNLLQKEVNETNRFFTLKFGQVNELTPETYSVLTGELLDAWLKEIERQYRKIWEKADDRLGKISDQLARERNVDYNLESLKEKHHNQKLEEQLTNKHELQKIRVVEDELIRKSDYIYTAPEGNFGSAHLYAPFKRWAGYKIDTLWFNILVIWFFNLLFYFLLLLKIPERIPRKKS